MHSPWNMRTCCEHLNIESKHWEPSDDQHQLQPGHEYPYGGNVVLPVIYVLHDIPFLSWNLATKQKRIWLKYLKLLLNKQASPVDPDREKTIKHFSRDFLETVINTLIQNCYIRTYHITFYSLNLFSYIFVASIQF